MPQLRDPTAGLTPEQIRQLKLLTVGFVPEEQPGLRSAASQGVPAARQGGANPIATFIQRLLGALPQRGPSMAQQVVQGVGDLLREKGIQSRGIDPTEAEKFLGLAVGAIGPGGGRMAVQGGTPKFPVMVAPKNAELFVPYEKMLPATKDMAGNIVHGMTPGAGGHRALPAGERGFVDPVSNYFFDERTLEGMIAKMRGFK